MINTILKFISRPYLVILGIIAIVVLVAPMLSFNINADPRLINYFDGDEGYIRDLAWYYYSGDKLESFDYTLDYGVELHLIIDFIVRPLGLFIPIGPNTILFILRLFHFLCGIIAIFVLWKFTKRHFTSRLIPTFICLSLIVSPQYVWWLDNIKPEPILIILILASLDYTLRILKEHSWRNVLLAVFFATAAFAIKLLGIFLLPGVLLALYFSDLKGRAIDKKSVFKILKQIGVMFISFLTSLSMILAIVIPIGSRLYLKMRTDNFDLEQFAENFTPPPALLISVYLAMFLLITGSISLVIYLYRKNKNSNAYKIISVMPLFIISFAVISYRWTFDLFGFGINYCRWLQQQQSAPLNFFHKTNVVQFVISIINNTKSWIMVLAQNDAAGVIGIALLMMYFIVEFVFKAWRVDKEKTRFLKRVILLIYCASFLIFLFLFQSHYTAQHLITINIIFLLLSFEGMRLIVINLKNKKIARVLVALLITAVLLSFFQQERSTLELRLRKFGQKDDIIYEIGQWWKKSGYSYDTKIVADSPRYIYVPSEFQNVIFVKPGFFLDISFKINFDRIEEIIKREKPRLIFYNKTKYEEDAIKIDQFLEKFRIRKVKEFIQVPSESFRLKEDRFVIYEIF